MVAGRGVIEALLTDGCCVRGKSVALSGLSPKVFSATKGLMELMRSIPQGCTNGCY